MNLIELLVYMLAAMLAITAVTWRLHLGLSGALYAAMVMVILGQILRVVNPRIERMSERWQGVLTVLLVFMLPSALVGLILTRGTWWKAVLIGLLQPVMWMGVVAVLHGVGRVLQKAFDQRKRLR